GVPLGARVVIVAGRTVGQLRSSGAQPLLTARPDGARVVVGVARESVRLIGEGAEAMPAELRQVRVAELVTAQGVWRAELHVQLQMPASGVCTDGIRWSGVYDGTRVRHCRADIELRSDVGWLDSVAEHRRGVRIDDRITGRDPPAEAGY